MKPGVWILRILPILLILPAVAPQSALAAENHLNDKQKLGRRLFEQSCGVCHTRPTLVSGMYGPELSKDTSGGNEAYMREVIANGTPRMPGFKYTHSPEQIAAIAAYLKTMPRGTQDIPTARAPTKAPTPAQ
ncbi:MAG TPA: cytochrome c [Candidatus Binatia bacterium]